jgi:hypothetical protein
MCGLALATRRPDDSRGLSLANDERRRIRRAYSGRRSQTLRRPPTGRDAPSRGRSPAWCPRRPRCPLCACDRRGRRRDWEEAAPVAAAAASLAARDRRPWVSRACRTRACRLRRACRRSSSRDARRRPGPRSPRSHDGVEGSARVIEEPRRRSAVRSSRASEHLVHPTHRRYHRDRSDDAYSARAASLRAAAPHRDARDARDDRAAPGHDAGDRPSRDGAPKDRACAAPARSPPRAETEPTSGRRTSS